MTGHDLAVLGGSLPPPEPGRLHGWVELEPCWNPWHKNLGTTTCESRRLGSPNVVDRKPIGLMMLPDWYRCPFPPHLVLPPASNDSLVRLARRYAKCPAESRKVRGAWWGEGGDEAGRVSCTLTVTL